LDRSLFFGDLLDALSGSQYDSNDSNSTIRNIGGDEIASCQLPAYNRNGLFNNQDSTKEQHTKLLTVCKTNPLKFLNWVGKHSLEIYLIHDFSLCILKLFIAPLALSAIGCIILFANFIVIVALSGFCIKKPETNNLLNKILF